MSAPAPRLRVIDASASPEEVAAIVAAVGLALGSGASPAEDAPTRAGWITASRLHARGAAMRRADWRWSDRLGGRVRT